MTTGYRAADHSDIQDAVDFRLAFENMPGITALLATDAPNYTILATTNEYLRLSGKKMKEVIGKSLFEAFPPEMILILRERKI